LIPYEQFEIEKDKDGNSEVLGEGGFSKVYKAKWNDENKIVALKVLNNSQVISESFLQEIANHQMLFNCGTIVKCYGVSRDPKSKNYLMVMDYIEGGDLRKLLQNNRLTFEEKLGSLLNIA
jgi:serine/threonine protein kinase